MAPFKALCALPSGTGSLVPCDICERVVLGKGAKVLHHIVEEEAESQVDEQDDKREDSQQEDEGNVAEKQTHNMSA